MSTRRSAPSDVEVHRAFVALAEAKSGADAIRVFDSNPHIRGASFVAAVWYRAASAGLGAGPNWDGETLDRLTRALYSALVKESAKCSPQVLVAAAAACSLHSPRLPPGRLDRHADLISARVSQRSAEFDLGQLASLRVAGTPSSWRGSAGKWLPELRLERHGGGHLRSSEEATIVAVPPTGLAWAPAGDAEPWGKPVVPDCDAAALIVALERAGSRPVVVEPGATQKDIKEGLIAAWSERS
ncbi:hypothetical protein FNF27_00564 [Cafeteria roenbergensis]|uniref:Uncharacterized protein n=1 Tax=Cafeteria roenbergensis TaxID=33653 RepID=A0A5A8EJE2_CAFRO|nr:hypothetical protein FNF27_00564 [Cafeteria roenbergensis]